MPSIKRKNIKKQIKQLLNNNPDNNTNNHIPTNTIGQTNIINMTATIDNTTTTITQNRNTLHKDMVMNINDDFDNPQLINTEQPYQPSRTPDYYKKIEITFIEIFIIKYKGTIIKYKGFYIMIESHTRTTYNTTNKTYNILNNILNSLIQKNYTIRIILLRPEDSTISSFQ